ncbi:hypothetical protein Hamer_G008466 [Homarus americanus]|uniref:Peptidase A2 domain-containing protein n=1 Tax=Homarus americanus TaxID=6706 RepID=A0A8J5T7Q3_HOMAM|nr:hypothetical protein Hamer_G008466 [Homarus americanus]
MAESADCFMEASSSMTVSVSSHYGLPVNVNTAQTATVEIQGSVTSSQADRPRLQTADRQDSPTICASTIDALVTGPSVAKCPALGREMSRPGHKRGNHPGARTWPPLQPLTDHCTGICFLIDTGVQFSVLPKPICQATPTSTTKLLAANDTCINTHDSKSVRLDLNLGRRYMWKFLVADVSFPAALLFLNRLATPKDLCSNHPVLSQRAANHHCIYGIHSQLPRKFP